MVDIRPTSNGSRFSLHINIATITLTMAALGFFASCFTYFLGYRQATAQMSQLYLWHTEDQAELRDINHTISSDREKASNRMTQLEDKVDSARDAAKDTKDAVEDLRKLTRGTKQ